MKPEGDPGYDDDQGGRDVDLDQVIAHASCELNLAGQARVIACGIARGTREEREREREREKR